MKRYLVWALLMVALLVVAAPVLAQDGSDTVPASEVALNSWQAIFGIVGALLAGVGIGSVGALVVVRNFVTRLRSDEATTLAIEKLYSSIPNEAIRTVIREGILAGVEVLDYADKLTDGVPGARSE